MIVGVKAGAEEVQVLGQQFREQAFGAPQIPETFKGVIENTIEEFRHLYPKWKQNRSLKRNRVVFESLNHLQNVLFRELPHDKEPDFSDKGGIREFIQSFKGFHKFFF